METLEKINVGVGLADSDLLCYSYSKNKKNILTVKIQAWNAKIIEFQFFDFLVFVDREGSILAGFYKNTSETLLLNETLRKQYEIIPQQHPYQLFQFLDIDDEPSLEIVSKAVKFSFVEDLV